MLQVRSPGPVGQVVLLLIISTVNLLTLPSICCRDQMRFHLCKIPLKNRDKLFMVL